MGACLRISLTISCLLLIWISASASIPSRESLGIAPQDLSYYKSDVIKCKDGSKKFTKEQLNDEFCDCPDGTDEPGTSACPQGKFYCPNVGHIPLTTFSSRVNDGICDCCDGSDEYNGNVSCPNTCWEAGKVAREKLQKKIATFQNGVTIRKQEVEKAKQAFAKDEAELSKLRSEEKILKELVQKLKEQKERIEKAEEEERKKREEEERRLKEAERKANESKNAPEESSHDITDQAPEKLSELHNQDAMEDHHDSAVEDKNDYTTGTEISDNQQVANDHDDTIAKSGHEADGRSDGSSFSHVEKQHVVEAQDNAVSKANTDYPGTEEELSSHVAEQGQVSDSTEGLSREELGRLVASRWTRENAAEGNDEVNMAKEGLEHDEDIREENHDGYISDSDEDHKFEDDDLEDDQDAEFGEDHEEPTGAYSSDEDDKTDYSDLTVSGSSSWLDKIQQTVNNVLQAFNFFRRPVNISEAATVRKEYDDFSSELSKIQSRISRLNEKLKYDFGKDREFYSFYDRCFESKQNKYTYKVCPFKKASQVEGHSSTQLGHWDKFDESYRVMLFSNGDRCWNGPDRSLKVRLRCGLKNELVDIDEPSRCEYVAILSTPALCLEEKIKELQQKLEDMNTGQPSAHDEL
ncbi:glucosidase 2 subunit beta isoform X2 [Elaeis guineensis]|uniref:Glucosidase 2 subunit beta n=1 Tax=Elaeis guineensis var. tenera TaxID=51953 RepID=A0A6I9R641_ELAGV|nr:glucosidase 2 subunit beta isoform X2 [Elaeis guineensis]